MQHHLWYRLSDLNYSMKLELSRLQRIVFGKYPPSVLLKASKGNQLRDLVLVQERAAARLDMVSYNNLPSILRTPTIIVPDSWFCPPFSPVFRVISIPISRLDQALETCVGGCVHILRKSRCQHLLLHEILLWRIDAGYIVIFCCKLRTDRSCGQRSRLKRVEVVLSTMSFHFDNWLHPANRRMACRQLAHEKLD